MKRISDEQLSYKITDLLVDGRYEELDPMITEAFLELSDARAALRNAEKAIRALSTVQMSDKDRYELGQIALKELDDE